MYGADDYDEKLYELASRISVQSMMMQFIQFFKGLASNNDQKGQAIEKIPYAV
jgi:hypothetical protein